MAVALPRPPRYGAPMRTLLAALLCASAVACAAAITPVAYNPQPERIADPAEELRTLILANTVQGCVSEPELNGPLFTVKFVCSSGVGNAVARLDRAKALILDESGGWYRLRVMHEEELQPFLWTSRSLKDITRMADAFSALIHRFGAPAPAPAKTSA